MEFVSEFLCASRNQRTWLGAWRFFDLFAYSPVPRWTYRRYSSFRSVVFSVLVVLLLFGYIAFTSRRWLVDTPQTSTSNIRLSDGSIPNVTISADDIVVGFQSLTGTGACGNECHKTQTSDSFPYLNESLFWVDIHNVFVDTAGVYHSERLPMRVIDAEWLGPVGKKLYASKGKPLIIGGGSYLNYREYAYADISVRLCQGVDSLTGKTVSCAGFDEIRDAFRNGEFVLGLRQYDETSGEEVNTIASYAATPLETQWYDTVFRLSETVVAPDFVRSFTTTTSTALARQMESFFLTSSFSKEEDMKDRPVLIFRILLDPVKSQRTYHVQSIGDLVGSWSALMGAMMWAGAIFAFYNKKKFYARHSAWDGYDKQFKYVGPQWFDSVRYDDEGELVKEGDGGAEIVTETIAAVDDEEMNASSAASASSPASAVGDKTNIKFANVGRLGMEEVLGAAAPAAAEDTEEKTKNKNNKSSSNKKKPLSSSAAGNDDASTAMLDNLLGDDDAPMSAADQAKMIDTLVQREVARQMAKFRSSAERAGSPSTSTSSSRRRGASTIGAGASAALSSSSKIDLSAVEI